MCVCVCVCACARARVCVSLQFCFLGLFSSQALVGIRRPYSKNQNRSTVGLTINQSKFHFSLHRTNFQNYRRTLCVIYIKTYSYLCMYISTPKGRRKRESKNAKQMRNTKQNCFSHSSVSPRNNKQCSAKQCFANPTNRCLADFASRSDLFLDNEHG